MIYTQKAAYIVLTNRQILLIESDPTLGGPSKFLASVPREEATVSVIKSGLLFLKVQLDVSEPSQLQNPAVARVPSVRLTFPPLPPSLRVTGRKFVASLNAATPATEAQPRR